jgi:predicted Rossmann fold flavoprotein
MTHAFDYDAVIVGGGAAGFFAAIHLKQARPEARVLILESAAMCLGKVRISGGGRCNVTHACFDVARLVTHYPRGEKALRSVLHRFGPQDTIDWFARHGVELKTEADGRMFPVSNTSETIVTCLQDTATALGIKIWTQCPVVSISKETNGFQLSLKSSKTPLPQIHTAMLVLATGSARPAYDWLRALGHQIVSPVPSLFTLRVADSELTSLSGLTLPCVSVSWTSPRNKKRFTQSGPLLVTHWGLSGPAVLKLSAWAARELCDADYAGVLRVDTLPTQSHDGLLSALTAQREYSGKKQLGGEPLRLSPESEAVLPKRFWGYVLGCHALSPATRWSELSLKQGRQLVETLKGLELSFSGKSSNKDEFVTAGGVALSDVSMQTLESRLVPGLYVVGELLDVDGVTGGFNFQNAWSTGALAGCAMAQRLSSSLP